MIGGHSVSVQSDVWVTVRVDKDLKEKADYLFECLGLNMSVTFNMFLRKAVNEEAIPFLVSTNGSGVHRLSAEHITSAFNTAVSNEVKANQQKVLPVAKFDVGEK